MIDKDSFVLSHIEPWWMTNDRMNDSMARWNEWHEDVNQRLGNWSTVFNSNLFQLNTFYWRLTFSLFLYFSFHELLMDERTIVKERERERVMDDHESRNQMDGGCWVKRDKFLDKKMKRERRQKICWMKYSESVRERVREWGWEKDEESNGENDDGKKDE